MRKLWNKIQKAFAIHIVSNRLTEPRDKYEPIVIEMYKEHLVELYDFAYEQALKTGKLDELKEIDRKINVC
jgi:hypothetical protein